MKFKIWEISLMVAVVVAVLWGVLLENGQKELSDKLIRLHVVAHSDTEEDQALKLEVRDAVLHKLDEILDGGETREVAKEKIEASISDIQETASNTVEENGKDNAVSVTIETEHFPTRIYDSFSLPAGNYMSLRVAIGEAEGKNWWCVVFPPLCVEAAEDAESAEEALEASGLTEDELNLITEEEGYIIKFRSLEIIDELKNLLTFS